MYSVLTFNISTTSFLGKAFLTASGKLAINMARRFRIRKNVRCSKKTSSIGLLYFLALPYFKSTYSNVNTLFNKLLYFLQLYSLTTFLKSLGKNNLMVCL